MDNSTKATRVSDAELVTQLRGMDAGHSLTIEERREAADTLEALQARIKDLDEAACELLTGWDSLVAANAELQRRIDAALALCDARHAEAVSQHGEEMDAQYVCLDEAEIRAALTTEEQER